MLKKNIYAMVLLGALVLSGCSAKEEVTEVVDNGQAIEVSPAVHKEKAVTATPLKLTQKQKEDYYKQYVEIVEEVMKEHPGTTMEVVPIEEFNEEDWVEPEKFRQRAIDRTQLEFVVEKEVIYGN